MELFWYLLIAVFMAMFFVLDGYDFGVGIIHLFYAKEEKDKVVVAKAAGLFWDSNEVWFVAAGGMLFMAFPVLYASAFSGFYLPLIIVLWLIIFRAIGLEFRNLLPNKMWHSIWDVSFGVSSLLLALFFGIALGNIARGVNLGNVVDGVATQESIYFFLPLWADNFSPYHSSPGVIDWFTIIIGLISMVTLAIHGATWIIHKTNASINEKLKNVITRLNIALVILTFFSLFIWQTIVPNALDNFFSKPLLLIFPLLFFASLFGMFAHKKMKDIHRFYLSSLIIIGGITSTLASMFPVIMPSSNDVCESLTIYNASTSHEGLSVSSVWGVIGVILVIVYLIVQNRLRSGKIDDMDYGH